MLYVYIYNIAFFTLSHYYNNIAYTVLLLYQEAIGTCTACVIATCFITRKALRRIPDSISSTHCGLSPDGEPGRYIFGFGGIG